MTIRDIAIAIGFEIDKNSEKAVENSIKGIKNTANKLLSALKIGFSIAGISDLAQTAADTEALKSQFSQVFEGMEETAQSKLDKIADETGVLANRMKGSFTQIASFSKTTGLNQEEALDIANRSLKAVADSAAFYDRSIEDATNSLQSFLKGNFENDAALGLSCTETTRNAAANELYGKSFKDLSEAQKQFTLLKMVEDANVASGALGQAAREADTWTNQLGNLKQSITDLKASIGNVFLKPAVEVLKLLSTTVQSLTKAVKAVTSENGLFMRSFERTHTLMKKLQSAIDRMFQTLGNALGKVKEATKIFTDKLGGAENALKILTLAVGAFFLVMNWSKIINGAKRFLGVISGISKIFSLANLKIMSVVSVIVLLALITEDFIHFLIGNDSLIGDIFDKVGISAENARKTIFAVWQEIRTSIGNILGVIITTITISLNIIASIISGVLNIIQTIWNVWGDEIVSIIKVAFSVISAIIETSTKIFQKISKAAVRVVNAFKLVGNTVSNITHFFKENEDALALLGVALGTITALIIAYNAANIAAAVVSGAETAAIMAMYAADGVAAVAKGALTAATTLWSTVAGIATTVTTALGTAMAFLTSPIALVILAIGALIAVGVLLYKNWDKIKTFAGKLWSGIVEKFKSGTGKVKELFNGIIEFIKNNWQSILTFIVNPFVGAFKLLYDNCDGFRNFINNLLSKIRDTFYSVLEEIKNLWNNSWSSIVIFFKGIWNNAINFFKDVINSVIEIASLVPETFKNIFQIAWNNVCTIFSNVSGFFENVFGKITGIFSNIGGVISDAITGSVKGAINSLLGGAANIINGFINGINTAIGIINAIPGVNITKLNELNVPMLAEGGIATSATNAIIGEGNEPEAILPLSKLGVMISSYIHQAKESDTGKQMLDVIKQLSVGVTAFAKVTTASPTTASNSTTNNSNSNIVQNVEINNSYSGGNTETQRNISTAMKKSAVDTTTEMARAIAIARG